MHLQKWKRWMHCTDLHGDRQEPKAVTAVLRFAQEFNPHFKIFGGDLCDLRPLRGKAHPDEKAESLEADVKAGRKFLEQYRPNIFLRGNHDERLYDTARMDGIIGDYAAQGVDALEELCKKLGTQVISYNKRTGIYQHGNYRFLHGYASGMSAARKTALCYGNVICGHGHQNQVAHIEHLDDVTGYMCGSLCLIDMDYNRAQLGTLAQENGFMYGLQSPSGKLYCVQAKQIEGRWITPAL